MLNACKSYGFSEMLKMMTHSYKRRKIRKSSTHILASNYRCYYLTTFVVYILQTTNVMLSMVPVPVNSFVIMNPLSRQIVQLPRKSADINETSSSTTKSKIYSSKTFTFDVTGNPLDIPKECEHPHHLQQQEQPYNEQQYQHSHNLDTFLQCLSSMSLPTQTQNDIIDIIQNTMEFTSSTELYTLSVDFVDRPEVLSHILRQDFGISVGKSHLIRGALMKLVDVMNKDDKINGHNDDSNDPTDEDKVVSSGANKSILQIEQDDNETNEQNIPKLSSSSSSAIRNENDETSHIPIPKYKEKKTKKQPLFKSVIVNTKAKQRISKSRRTNQQNHSNENDSLMNNNYGLPPNYQTLYPKLGTELEEFLIFMTKPSTISSQESPIRKATACVYMRHAKLFLGWWTKQNQFLYNDDVTTIISTESTSSSTTVTIYDHVSIYEIFPNNESKSAQPIIDFILWLRETRDISNSYEANMLRGLTKLLKFRFCQESQADPSYGEKSFSDIQAVREIRKLHRDANRRQILSPRSSEEDKKWLDWDEYLGVIKAVKQDLEDEIYEWEKKEQHQEKKAKKIKKNSSKNSDDRVKSSSTAAQRRVAMKYQAYLILAFFSCVPDRQRTFRELELDKTFLKDANLNSWIIKHGPDDYKTGSTYGDRPPLVLAEELTPSIDDFLARWRLCLSPNTNHFFVQPRTGNAFTQDSVYSLVARSCYKYSGKKTNPHLLRDMIVTHVRDSNASEKELEALALYMGHSINMQRTSYDRRTMKQKIAPAVQLLQNVNSKKSAA